MAVPVKRCKASTVPEESFRGPARFQLLQKAMFLRDLAAKSKPTLTHQWLASLGDKLLRLYTQNIDMLEDKAGLKTGLGRQFNCVQLHGTIANLQCNLCKEVYPWETFRDDINLSRDSLYTRGTDRSKAREAVESYDSPSDSFGPIW